jgi:hypothetical protein
MQVLGRQQPFQSNEEEIVRSKVTVQLLCLALCSFLSTVVLAQEFSADVVDLQNQPNPTPGKIYVGKDKMRFEGKEHGGKSAAMIINFATQTTDILVPERQMYIESTQSMSPQRSFSFFRPTDIENACGDWQKLARKPGGTCHKVGNEVVNGRNAVKYEGTSADGDTGYVWIDPKLKFVVKWQGKSGGRELRKIQEGSQPDSLFAIPAGYQKMDMGNMMQHPAPPHQ